MKNRYCSSIYNKVVGATLGGVVGGIGATVATFWGGYELGSAINDTLNFTNTIGRGTLDLVVMGLVARPAYSIGINVGILAGGAIGTITQPAIEGMKDLGKLVSKGYNKVTGKKIDEPTDKYFQ